MKWLSVSTVKRLALCKNHHWASDHGWFGLDDDYRIVIPQGRFMEEAAVESREMVAFGGEVIGLPREREFRPSLEGLRWHGEDSRLLIMGNFTLKKKEFLIAKKRSKNYSSDLI